MTDQSPTDPPSRTVRDRVAQVIEEIRPFIQRDGGDIELVEVTDQGQVSVRLQGACVGCPMSQMTMTQGVERRIREQVSEVTQVTLVPPQ
ncbi:MAG: NifU family protein [bacterium]|nr:NifU family protein [bacterium]